MMLMMRFSKLPVEESNDFRNRLNQRDLLTVKNTQRSGERDSQVRVNYTPEEAMGRWTLKINDF